MDIALVVVSQTIRGAYKANRGTDVVSIPMATGRPPAVSNALKCVAGQGSKPDATAPALLKKLEKLLQEGEDAYRASQETNTHSDRIILVAARGSSTTNPNNANNAHHMDTRHNKRRRDGNMKTLDTTHGERIQRIQRWWRGCRSKKRLFANSPALICAGYQFLLPLVGDSKQIGFCTILFDGLESLPYSVDSSYVTAVVLIYIQRLVALTSPGYFRKETAHNILIATTRLALGYLLEKPPTRAKYATLFSLPLEAGNEGVSTVYRHLKCHLKVTTKQVNQMVNGIFIDKLIAKIARVHAQQTQVLTRSSEMAKCVEDIIDILQQLCKGFLQGPRNYWTVPRMVTAVWETLGLSETHCTYKQVQICRVQLFEALQFGQFSLGEPSNVWVRTVSMAACYRYQRRLIEAQKACVNACDEFHRQHPQEGFYTVSYNSVFGHQSPNHAAKAVYRNALNLITGAAEVIKATNMKEAQLHEKIQRESDAVCPVLRITIIVHLGFSTLIHLPYYHQGDLFVITKANQRQEKTCDRLYKLRRLLQLLAKLHARGILHKDFKLENVFIGNKGEWLLGDWEFASFNEVFKESRSGTLSYMPPEFMCEVVNGHVVEKSKTCSCNKTFDGKAAEVWTAGVFMFVLFAKCFPFRIGVKDFQQLYRGEFKIPERIGNHNLRSLLSKMLRFEPHWRPTMEQVLDHPLFAELPQIVR